MKLRFFEFNLFVYFVINGIVFVVSLSFRKPVYVYQISGRFDVGNLPSYIECDLYFREQLQDVESYMV